MSQPIPLRQGIKTNLLAIRRALGIRNNHEFATVLNIPFATLTYWLRGEATPSLESLLIMARQLGVITPYITGELPLDTWVLEIIREHVLEGQS